MGNGPPKFRSLFSEFVLVEGASEAWRIRAGAAQPASLEVLTAGTSGPLLRALLSWMKFVNLAIVAFLFLLGN